MTIKGIYRLEVTSPGMLLNNVTISKMMEGYSKPRNPAIARAFAYMKIPKVLPKLD